MWSILAFDMMLKAWANSAREEALRLLTGEGQIHATGYLDDPGVDHRMAAPSGALLHALNHGQITVLGAARARAGRHSKRIPFARRDVPGRRSAKGATISDLPGEIETGRYLHDDNDAAIVLGRHMIERLKTRLGKRVIIMSQAADGHLAEQSFTVIGAFGGAEGVQDEFAFTGLRAAQSMLGIGGDLSEISFDAANDKTLPPAIQSLKKAAPRLDIEPWTQFSPLAYAMDQLLGTYVAIWLQSCSC